MDVGLQRNVGKTHPLVRPALDLEMLDIPSFTPKRSPRSSSPTCLSTHARSANGRPLPGPGEGRPPGGSRSLTSQSSEDTDCEALLGLVRVQGEVVAADRLASIGCYSRRNQHVDRWRSRSFQGPALMPQRSTVAVRCPAGTSASSAKSRRRFPPACRLAAPARECPRWCRARWRPSGPVVLFAAPPIRRKNPCHLRSAPDGTALAVEPAGRFRQRRIPSGCHQRSSAATPTSRRLCRSASRLPRRSRLPGNIAGVGRFTSEGACAFAPLRGHAAEFHQA